MQLRPLQDREAHLERLVDELVDFAQLDSEQILREDFKVDAVRLFGESIRLRLIVQEADVGSLADVLDRLAIERGVNQLVERTLRLVTAALGPAYPVELNVLLNSTKE